MFNERLVVVGTGIRAVGQLTIESMAWIKRADSILHIVEDPIAVTTIQNLNPAARQSTLVNLYQEGKPRIDTYRAMVETILASVRSCQLTVCVFYGHPGVMAYPGHESIRRARIEGFKARMLPGISAEDCLFADLCVDPATHGCQTYEATDVLWNDRHIDPSTHLILWQIGVLGNITFSKGSYNLSALPILIEKLLRSYPPSHEVTVYEAAIMIGCEPIIISIPLIDLRAETITPRSTLSIPPLKII